jgi:hypothetical protein
VEVVSAGSVYDWAAEDDDDTWRWPARSPTDERANYDGAMADLGALVDIACEATRAAYLCCGCPSLRPLAHHLQMNYPQQWNAHAAEVTRP